MMVRFLRKRTSWIQESTHTFLALPCLTCEYSLQVSSVMVSVTDPKEFCNVSELLSSPYCPVPKFVHSLLAGGGTSESALSSFEIF